MKATRILALVIAFVALAAGCGGGGGSGTSAARPPATAEAIDSTTAETTTTTTTTTTTIPTRAITGSVVVLDDIGFDGENAVQDLRVSAGGESCDSGDGGFGPNSAVVVADGSGTTLATAALGGGSTVAAVRGTQAERDARGRLLAAMFDYEIAVADRNTRRIAEIQLEAANQQTKDLEGPDDLSFRGMSFQASWCEYPFAAEVPATASVVVTVPSLPPMAYDSAQLDANGGRIEIMAG